jgi:hypothetical protein
MSEPAPRSAILRHTESVGKTSISAIEMIGH